MRVDELNERIDVAIICVLPVEKDAILERFQVKGRVFVKREYLLSSVARDDGEEISVAIVMSGEGSDKSQDAMNDIVKDLEPKLTLLVGIAGGIPQKNGSLFLGDVAVSTAGINASRGELNPERTYRSKPRPFQLHKTAQELVRDIRLNQSWANESSIRVPRPKIDKDNLVQLKDCKDSWFSLIEGSYPGDSEEPRFICGTFASGPAFVRDDTSARKWQKSAEGWQLPALVAYEMEMIGVDQASRDDDRVFSYLVIKGISDIIGLERDKAWTPYAAATAASFALSFVKGLVFQTKSQKAAASVPPPGFGASSEIFDGISADETPADSMFSSPHVQVGLALSEAQAQWKSINAQTEIREFSAAWLEISTFKNWLLANSRLLPTDQLRKTCLRLCRVTLMCTQSSRLPRGEMLEQALVFLDQVEREQVATTAEDEELSNLRLLVEQLRGDEKAALALSTKEDPVGITSRLICCLQTRDTVEEHAWLVRERQPQRIWLFLGIQVLVLDSDLRSAHRLVEWARTSQSPQYWSHAVLVFCESLLKLVYGEREDLVITDISETAKDWLSEIRSTITPHVKPIVLRQRVDNALEAGILEVALICDSLIPQPARIQELAGVLRTYDPIPLQIGHLVVNGTVGPTPQLAERLRNGHPNSIDAACLAARVEALDPKNTFTAVERLLPRIYDARSSSEKDLLANTLNELSSFVDKDMKDRIEKALHYLKPDDQLFHKRLEAERLIREKCFTEAMQILENNRDEDNPVWLQLYAFTLIETGDAKRGLWALEKATKVVPHVTLLHRAASLAVSLSEFERANEMFQLILRQDPENEAALCQLFQIELNSGNTGQAREYLEQLSQIRPTKLEYRINQAIMAIRNGDAESGRDLYKAICEDADGNPPLVAALGWARCELALSRPEAAFAALDSLFNSFSDNQEFLATYLSTAFYSNKEDKVPAILTAIQTLEGREGNIEPAFKRAGIAEFTQHAQEFRERKREAAKMLLRGELTCVAYDALMGQPSYLGWKSRTQSLDWVPEQPEAYADFTTYASNFFHVSPDTRKLERLPLPPRGESCSIDLAGLLTLNELDLLQVALDYFGEVFIPAASVVKAVEEAANLLIHQPSRVDSLEMIRNLVNEKRLKVAEEGSDTCVVLNEHDGEILSLKIADLAKTLQLAGLISQEELNETLRHLGKKLPDTERVALNQTVQVDVLSLCTLAGTPIAGELYEHFELVLGAREFERTVSDLRRVKKQEEVLRKHRELWRMVRLDKRFTIVETGEFEFSAPLSAFDVAKRKETKLFSDDRALQTAALIELKGAFGTPQFLAALRAEPTLGLKKYAAHLRMLTRWRYRFLVVPAEVLVEFANQYQANPPGRALCEFAEYMNDSFHDLGLFKGTETSEPPMSMAMALFLAWLNEIALTLVKLWTDTSWTEQQLRQVTCWMALTMVPRLTHFPGRINRDRRLAKKFLVRQMLAWGSVEQELDRLRDGTRYFASCLGFSLSEYETIGSDAILRSERRDDDGS